jgi:putative DNA primase/helicase
MPSGDTLGIAEGIETALAASQLFHLPVWACLNAGLLQKWEPPKTVKRVVIFADNDPSYAGQAAAYGLAYKLQSAFDVEVRTPDNPGDDWNDILCRDMGLPRPGSRKTPKETRHVDRNETSEVVHY